MNDTSPKPCRPNPETQAVATTKALDMATDRIGVYLHDATGWAGTPEREHTLAILRDELGPFLVPRSPVESVPEESDDISYSRSYALQLCELVTASENLLSTCEVDFFARRDGTADAVVQKDYWNKWVTAVRALKLPQASVLKSARGTKT